MKGQIHFRAIDSAYQSDGMQKEMQTCLRGQVPGPECHVSHIRAFHGTADRVV